MHLSKSYLIAIVLFFLVFCVPAFGAYGPVPPGYPNASTTGIAGVDVNEGDLTTEVGLKTCSTPGEVIELKNFPDGVYINANNVTIKKCKIGLATKHGVEIASGKTGTVIEDCLLLGRPQSPVVYRQGSGLNGRNFTIRRCDISMYHDGVKTYANSITEDNYMHDWLREEYAPGEWTHNDCTQSSGGDSNVIVRRNTLRGPFEQSNAAIQLGTAPGTGNIDNFFYEDNLLGGGSTCVQVTQKNGYLITNITFRRNVWELGTWNSNYLLYQSTNDPPTPLEPATFICNKYDDGSYLTENPPCDYIVADANDDQVVIDTDGDSNETITLNGSGSYHYFDGPDYGAPIGSYIWKEDDIQIATGEIVDVNLSVGVHTIVLEVNDINDWNDTDEVEIIVGALPDSVLAQLDIEFDANSSGISGINASTFSWSHTIGDGNDRLLVVGLALYDPTVNDMNVSSLTYDGIAMTAVADSAVTAGTGADIAGTELFYMLDADLPAAGTYTVVVNFDGAVIVSGGGATSLKNVQQQPPEAVVTHSQLGGLSPVGNIYTSIVTETANCWLIDTVANSRNGTFEPDGDPCMTERWEIENLAVSGAGATKLVPYIGYSKMKWVHYTNSNNLAHSIAAFAPSIITKAHNPQPSDKQSSVDVNSILSWTGGAYAGSHDVYLGTDFNDVNEGQRHFCDLDGSMWIDFGDVKVMANQFLDASGSADLDDLNGVNFVDLTILNGYWGEFAAENVFMGNQPFDVNTFDPNGLDPAQTHYWRIDEVNDVCDDSPWTGDVWQLTTQ